MYRHRVVGSKDTMFVAAYKQYVYEIILIVCMCVNACWRNFVRMCAFSFVCMFRYGVRVRVHVYVCARICAGVFV